jgi:hypothetical protein
MGACGLNLLEDCSFARREGIVKSCEYRAVDPQEKSMLLVDMVVAERHLLGMQ